MIKRMDVAMSEQKQYELPEELWKKVMTYFHSSYKKPLHYEAVSKCEYFMRRRNINKYWGLSPISNLTKYGTFDSFYIWIVLNNWTYWEMSDLDIYKPDFTMIRRVAKGQVKKDFEEIWQTYADHSGEGNLLSRIYY